MSADPASSQARTIAPAVAPLPERSVSAGHVRAAAIVSGLALAFLALHQAYGLWIQRAYTSFGVDDEGYVLVSLRAFLRGEALYDGVFTQYGPAFFFLLGLPLRVLGLDPTHDFGRTFTGLEAIVVAGLLAASAWRVTGSLLAAALTLVLSRAITWQFFVEPVHPHGMTWVLTALVLYVASGPLEELRGSRAATLGVLVGLLAMIKLNVGAIVGVGLLAGLVGGRVPRGPADAPRARASRVRWWMAWVAAGTLPLLLVRGHLIEEGMTTFAVVMFGTLVARALASGAAWTEARIAPRVLAPFVAASALTIFTLAGAALACGTSLGGLWWGLVGQHARFVTVATAPNIEIEGRANAIASVGLALAWLGLRRLRARFAEGVAVVLALAWAGVTTADLLVPAPPVLMTWSLPYAWIVLALPARSFPGGTKGHVPWVLASLAAFHVLQPFPVPGSQLYWAVLLLAPLCAIAWQRSFTLVAEWIATRRASPRLAFAAWAIAGALGIERAIANDLEQVAVVERELRWTVPVALPGASSVRALERDAAALRWLNDSARAAGRFYSLPSINSIYLTSGVEPLTNFNFTFRPELLRAQERQAVADALRREPNVFVALDPGFERYVFGDPTSRADVIAAAVRERCTYLGRWSSVRAYRTSALEPAWVSCARVEGDFVVLRTGCAVAGEVAALEIVSLASNLVVGHTALDSGRRLALSDERGTPIELPSARFSAPVSVRLGPLDQAQRTDASTRKLVAVRLLASGGRTLATFPLVSQ